MKEAVIVSTARTPIGRAYRGAFNNTKPPTMAGHAIREAVRRAGIAPDEIDDLKVISGVGKVLEGKLQGIGVYRFKQVAFWTDSACKEFNKL